MKKLLLAVVALACIGSVATAGPNEKGVLNAFLLEGVVYTIDHGATEYCVPICCENGVTTSTGPDTKVVVLVAQFCPGSALAGITFGWTYPANIGIVEVGSCGEFELATNNWPDSGEGTAVTFTPTRLDPCVAVYWFAGYDYYQVPAEVTLGGHPTQGAKFADDSVPAILDPIACLGRFGFGGAPGFNCCPPDCGPPPEPEACCFEDGHCEMQLPSECQGTPWGPGTVCQPNPCPQPEIGACCVGELCTPTTEADCDGEWLGAGVECEPVNPCIVVPTVESTWGQIKATYR
jgi:hypothetical protein